MAWWGTQYGSLMLPNNKANLGQHSVDATVRFNGKGKMKIKYRYKIDREWSCNMDFSELLNSSIPDDALVWYEGLCPNDYPAEECEHCVTLKELKMELQQNKFSLIPAGNTPANVDTSIRAFNEPLAELLDFVGLPVDNVLNPIEERRKVIFSLVSVLEILPYEQRQKSVYLSKFTVAITAGLFDGALNFLWDETVKALRRMAVKYDLQYFFSVAESVSARYKNLNKEEDLEAISEFDLLDICRRIGLINDLNHKRLEHVNYLRNHASAAHPNEHEISGHEMISLLENCLRYAITAIADHSVIQIKTLFENIRKHKINDDDFNLICEELEKQPQERINDFIQSIFGIYCDPRQEQHTKENIEKLISTLWASCEDEIKYRIGSKYGVYRKNGENDRRNAAQKFLEIADGLEYKDEDSLVAELIEKLQDLRTVHFGWNNFYNEYPHAKSIADSLPKQGIPKAARKLFVRVICQCWIGNGKGFRKGVDERAIVHYSEFISMFGIEEVKTFLELLADPEFVTDLENQIPDARVRQLAKRFKAVTTDIHINRALDLVIAFPQKSIGKITTDFRYKEIIKNIK
jgi:hypothetical protein